jgi:hypothetical protein
VGGAVTIGGNCHANITTVGGHASSPTSTSGGDSGAITIGGRLKGNITSIGGDGWTLGGNTGNIYIEGDCTGVLTIDGGNAQASSGVATGGNIGTSTSTAVFVGGDLRTKNNLVFRPGSAVNTGLSTGTGGTYIGGSSVNPAIEVVGDLICFSFTARGGHGRTSGGNSGFVAVHGNTSIRDTLELSGGNATNGTGQAGRCFGIHCISGADISTLTVNPTTGVANGGNSQVYFNGHVSIRSWNVNLTFYPVGRFFEYVNSSLGGSRAAQLIIGTRTQDGGTDGTNALVNVIPRSGTGVQATIMGRFDGTNTVWKYKIFNNT